MVVRLRTWRAAFVAWAQWRIAWTLPLSIARVVYLRMLSGSDA